MSWKDKSNTWSHCIHFFKCIFCTPLRLYLSTLCCSTFLLVGEDRSAIKCQKNLEIYQWDGKRKWKGSDICILLKCNNRFMWRHNLNFETGEKGLGGVSAVEPGARGARKTFKQRVAMVSAVHLPSRQQSLRVFVQPSCELTSAEQVLLPSDAPVHRQKHVGVATDAVADSQPSQQSPLPHHIRRCLCRLPQAIVHGKHLCESCQVLLVKFLRENSRWSNRRNVSDVVRMRKWPLVLCRASSWFQVLLGTSVRVGRPFRPLHWPCNYRGNTASSQCSVAYLWCPYYLAPSKESAGEFG